MRVLQLAHDADDLRRFVGPRAREALPNPIERAGPGLHELHFAVIHERRVVEVDRELIGKERSDAAVPSKELIDPAQRTRCGKLLRQTIRKHSSDEPQVRVVLARPTSARNRGHDIGSRVDTISAVHAAIESGGITLDIKAADDHVTNAALESLPRLDPIEDLEQQDPKHKIVLVVLAAVYDLTDQKLTYPVGSSIRVSEAVLGDDGIVGPWRHLAMETREVNPLP